MTLSVVLVIIYFLIVGYLGYKGWRETQTAADYMIAGREVHPYIMAMSYGATFISTSAIIGFGGAASLFGMGILWLTWMNIFFGIFVAFAIFGKRTRRLGHVLDAHTFPELLGRRYQSAFIQGFSGIVIFLFMPIYAAAVLIGISRFIEVYFHVPYAVGVLAFSLILALYVIWGGLKGVMYTDAFQGTIMLIMMIVLLVYTYALAGGVIPAHQFLADMTYLVP
ncbi:MAG: sodium:solute symporter family protein, partial [Deltaproteobacteria bacterium]|nr:sodium:solute symporter family protein [Deltaproteobacteria bacterium]